MAKRTFDIVVGGALLVVALPVVVVLAVMLAIELRAFPFFVQDRIGAGGRSFRFLKLRTLPPTTPRYALKHELDPQAVSRFRAFLRERHVDELPQLLHVLTGELSLVGPRPRMPDDHEPVDAAYARWRVQVPQGCTGLWQVGAHTALLPSDHPEYDRFYIEHGTVAMDAWILWRTILQAIGLGRPVTLAEVPRLVLRRIPATERLAGVDAVELSEVVHVIDLTEDTRAGVRTTAQPGRAVS